MFMCKLLPLYNIFRFYQHFLGVSRYYSYYLILYDAQRSEGKKFVFLASKCHERHRCRRGKYQNNNRKNNPLVTKYRSYWLTQIVTSQIWLWRHVYLGVMFGQASSVVTFTKHPSSVRRVTFLVWRSTQPCMKVKDSIILISHFPLRAFAFVALQLQHDTLHWLVPELFNNCLIN